MHFEILVEDASGKKMLDHLVPEIIGVQHTFQVTAYKGIGRVPKGLKSGSEANKRILLDQLPKLLRGYGNAYKKFPPDYQVAVIVVCDLDIKCLKSFRQELLTVLHACDPRPETRFCIAIEEGEAWFLGDLPAIKLAYPKAKESILAAYENDSICGTWEVLANAICKGGAKALKDKGYIATGNEKTLWAEKITPHMDVENNKSPSFSYFRQKLLELAGS